MNIDKIELKKLCCTLRPSHLATLLYMASIMDENNEVFRSIVEMSAEVHISDGTITDALKVLIDLGLVERIRYSRFRVNICLDKEI